MPLSRLLKQFSLGVLSAAVSACWCQHMPYVRKPPSWTGHTACTRGNGCALPQDSSHSPTRVLSCCWMRPRVRRSSLASPLTYTNTSCVAAAQVTRRAQPGTPSAGIGSVGMVQLAQ